MGELPLLAIVDALPSDVVIGLEVPNRARMRAGDGVRGWLHHYVTAARDLLARRAT